MPIVLRSLVLRVTIILVAALALATSWLDVRAFGAAWLGTILLFTAVAGLSRQKAFAAGILFGLLYMIVALNWAPHMLAITLDSDEELLMPWMVFVAIAAWESIPFGLVCSAAAAAAERVVPVWACASGWIVMERFWPRVFPWSFAHTQIGFPPMVQAAELGGMYLVSFVFVYACLDIGVRINRKEYVPQLATCVPLLLVVLSLTFGWFRVAALDASLDRKETIRVGVVQVVPAHVDSMKKMREASGGLPPVDLLVWPESTLGTYSTAVQGLDDIRHYIKIAHMPFLDWKEARGLDAWLLVGGKTFEPGASDEGPYYQTAYLIDKEDKFRGRYLKRTLMPIGEYMPLEHIYPELHDWAQLSYHTAWGTSDAPLIVSGQAKISGLSATESTVPQRFAAHPTQKYLFDKALASGGVPIGVLLCYEDIVAEMSRRSVAQGAELLVSLINASAFEDSLALEQHLRLATLRSVENRRTLIRCSGTGVSCCIEPTGKIVKRLPPNTEGQFAVKARLNRDRTIYNRFGYLFPHLAAGALGVLVIKAYRPERQRKTSPPQPV